jgi:hypothetical protein
VREDLCSTVHEKRSTEAAIGNSGVNWTMVGAADFNGDDRTASIRPPP